MQDPSILAIAPHALRGVVGGGSAWDSFVKSQRTAVAPAYRNVVCTTAGIKGGPELATQVYGADRTTGGDKIRAAETIRGVCMGGSRLPDAAPPSPF